MNLDVPIYKNDILKLKGISNTPVFTMGSVLIDIKGTKSEFHIVNNEFPILQDAILGSEFHGRNRAVIDWNEETVRWKDKSLRFKNRETVVIPKRSSKVYYVRVKNPEVKEGYIPRLDAGSGIYLGAAVVSNKGGVACLMAFNSNEEDVELTVPAVTLEAFELCDPSSGYSLKDRNQTDVTLSVEDADGCKIDQMTANFALKIEKDSTKFEQVKNLLRLNDLNDEERINIENLIEKNVDLFNIPGEFLDHTNAVEHKISTVDDQPVFTRQYRFPPAHKDEISKQVGELIEGKIIEPSDSPYCGSSQKRPIRRGSQGGEW